MHYCEVIDFLGNSNPSIMIIFSIMSKHVKTLYTGDKKIRLLDPTWSVFSLTSTKVNSRSKRSTLSDEILFQLFTTPDQEEAIAFSDPYQTGQWYVLIIERFDTSTSMQSETTY